jgi:hypothetical protein
VASQYLQEFRRRPLDRLEFTFLEERFTHHHIGSNLEVLVRVPTCPDERLRRWAGRDQALMLRTAIEAGLRVA